MSSAKVRASSARAKPTRRVAQGAGLTRPGYVPLELTDLLLKMGWAQGDDGCGALIWYPPACKEPKTRHHDAIVRGIRSVLRKLPASGRPGKEDVVQGTVTLVPGDRLLWPDAPGGRGNGVYVVGAVTGSKVG